MPGEAIKAMAKSKGLTISHLSWLMHMSRSHLYRIINGYVRITHRTAKKLSTHVGGTPEFWLMLQAKWEAGDGQ